MEIKETTIVELTREDIESAIAEYIQPKGYQAKSFTFTYKKDFNGNFERVDGVKVTVEKQ